MRNNKYILALVTFVTLGSLTSCNNDNDIVDPDNGWNYLEGVRYTKDTPFCWRWTEEWDDFDGSHTWHHSEERSLPFEDDEYIEFSNISNSGMTIRWGVDKANEYFDLGAATGHKYDYTFLRPQFHLESQAVDIPITYDGLKLALDCDLKGSLKIEDGYEIGLFGNRKYEDLKIMYYRKNRFNGELVTRYDKEGKGRWGAIDYKFDSNRMKCAQSPIYLEWQTNAWNGDIASSIENPADFLQLIMAIPVFKAADYGFSGIDIPREDLSFERLTRILYAGILVNDSTPRLMGARTKRLSFGYPSDMLTMVDIGGNTMKMYVDLKALFEEPFPASNDLRVDYYCNVARSLLSESKSYFPMDFQIRETDKFPAPRYLDFRLKNEQDSRQLLQNLIIPYMIAHLEEIKAYIQNHPTLSKHSAALCSAMDRLEELVEGTTKITIGYNMVEIPVGGAKTFEHLCREIWESDPEIE